MQKSLKTLEVGAQNCGRRRGSKGLMVNKCLPLIGITVIMALLIVWEKVQATKYGYEMAIIHNKINGLREKNRRLESDISALKKPQRIVQSIQSMGLNLAQPLENKDRIAKTKQQLNPEKTASSNTTILVSARDKVSSRQRNNVQRKVQTRGDRR